MTFCGMRFTGLHLFTDVNDLWSLLTCVVSKCVTEHSTGETVKGKAMSSELTTTM